MYRAALRSSSASLARAARQPVLAGGARRMLTTAPASKKSTWKGSFARWGVAIGAVYWYSTSPIFADEASKQLISAPPVVSEPELPSVDAVLEEKRKHEAEVAEKLAREAAEAEKSKAEGKDSKEAAADDAQSVEALEGEASQQGAFNPETGEINWDCPCLGGMAHGPCGEEFKSAFSCFVYSEQEPKGMDCIDKFQHMQDCFRLHPDVYGAELTDEEEGEAAGAVEGAAPATIEAGETKPAAAPTAEKVLTKEAEAPATEPKDAAKTDAPKVKESKKAKEPKETKEVKETKKTKETKVKEAPKTPKAVPTEAVPVTDSTPESDEHIPKAAHDATAGRK